MKNIVFISGVFNVLHPGHLRIIRFAKEIGNYLIVGVESDRLAKNKALIKENLRLESVKQINLVDEAFIFDISIIDLIKKIKPKYIIKGKEYENQKNIESKILAGYGGKLIFSSGESVFSSTDLINREINLDKNKLLKSNINVRNFLNRHKINRDHLIAKLEKIKELKVCIIGDLIVDEYIECDPLGMSQEDPTIVVSPTNSKMYIGGSAIVAAHASQLGAKVSLISVIGNDMSAKFARTQLKKYRINDLVISSETRKTTLKQRFRCKGKTLLRVSSLSHGSIEKDYQVNILEKLTKIIKNIDLLVFSDFNYGVLPSQLIESIIKIAKKKNVFVAADSQSSSQIGDICRFKNIDLITPTEREARISLNNFQDGLVVICDQLYKKSNPKNILLKLGEEGVFIHLNVKKEWHTDQFPALNKNPVDTAGAGDSMLVLSSMLLTLGSNIWEAAFISSLAASIQISRVGNIPITMDEVLNRLEI